MRYERRSNGIVAITAMSPEGWGQERGTSVGTRPSTRSIGEGFVLGVLRRRLTKAMTMLKLRVAAGGDIKEEELRYL